MLLATTSHSLLRVDPRTGAFEPIHRGLGLYFGIATDGRRRFVAARGRMVSSAVPHEEERGRILVFDEAMRLAGELQAPFPMRDLHEILWHEGRLWATCSFDNLVAAWDEASGEWEAWHPLGPTPAPPFDVNHFNSLAFVEGRLCVVAHNFGASELLRFDPATRELVSREPFGVQAHNIRVRPRGHLMTCSSAEGALVGTDGWRVETGGFPRGLLFEEGRCYVGISEIAERKDRDLTAPRILAFDPHWRLAGTIELPGEGLLLDLQPYPG
jgi:streptogramin lyase